MASAGARAYNGGLGRSPQRGPGAKPWSGGQGRFAPEAEDYFAPGHSTDLQSLSVFQYFTAFSVVHFLSHVSRQGHGVPPRKAEGERRYPAFPLSLTTELISIKMVGRRRLEGEYSHVWQIVTCTFMFIRHALLKAKNQHMSLLQHNRQKRSMDICKATMRN